MPKSMIADMLTSQGNYSEIYWLIIRTASGVDDSAVLLPIKNHIRSQ